MEEQKFSPKQKIELVNNINNIVKPLVMIAGRAILKHLPERNPHLNESEHTILGYWGTTSVSSALESIPQLKSDPENTLIICDMDGPLINLLPRLIDKDKEILHPRLFKVNSDEVSALEQNKAHNIYASDRGINFPGTRKIIKDMQNLGISPEDAIFLRQDKSSLGIRDQKRFNELVEKIQQLGPTKIFLIYDVLNVMPPSWQDLFGTSANYLKDILHKLSPEQQKAVSIGVIGVNPHLKETIYIPAL